MPRHPRPVPGGLVYHCLNRAVARLFLFQKDGDDEAFERVLVEAHERRAEEGHWGSLVQRLTKSPLSALLCRCRCRCRETGRK